METVQQQAAGLVMQYRENINYFIKFGSPIEKAMAQVIMEAAGEQPCQT
jgi:hypothetical protein